MLRYNNNEVIVVFAEVNGMNLYYEQSGMGRPLILLHGNGEDHAIFDEAVDILKERYTCYALDTRSHGHSERCSELHYQDMADDVCAFIQELDLENVILYGFSDGAIAAMLAATGNERVKDLILSGANLCPEDLKPWIRHSMQLCHLVHKGDKIGLMLREPHIMDENLREITARTLVLAGGNDIVSIKKTEHIAKMIPHAEMRILAGERHSSYVVHNRKIADIILAFAG